MDMISRFPPYLLLVVLAFVSPVAQDSFAAAQTFPVRPVRAIVTTSAGGGVDITMRTVCQKLTETWGQPVVVDNRTGASGIMAPAGLPKALVAKINGEIERILAKPEVRDRLSADGAQPGGGPPERFGAFIKAEITKWAKVVKGIKLDSVAGSGAK